MSRPSSDKRCTVAALYVEKGGIYYGLPRVDPWDEERNALRYDGPYPVVAHPPCKHWSQMGQCWGYRPRDEDYATFGHALGCVRRFGGVLEHPANSKAWKVFNLPAPSRFGWAGVLWNDGGWTTEVDQAMYGHPCNKRTWLYVYGFAPPAMRWGFAPDTGRKVAQDGGGGRDQRSRTPVEFRDVLLSLARSSQMAVAA